MSHDDINRVIVVVARVILRSQQIRQKLIKHVLRAGLSSQRLGR